MVARIARTVVVACLMGSVCGSYWLVNAQQRKQDAEPVVYALKPDKLPGYTPPHKPHTRLADLKAKHKGKKEWSEWVVQDAHLWSQYVQSAPGSRVSPRFHPDTRIWWVIIEGQIRFNIEGQESFVARRRSMVQVPPQTIYSMETLGDQRPSGLRPNPKVLSRSLLSHLTTLLVLYPFRCSWPAWAEGEHRFLTAMVTNPTSTWTTWQPPIPSTGEAVS